jgi:hypothetical protein
MNTRKLAALVALVSASFLVGGAPVSAAPIAKASQMTHLAVDLIADAHLARQALVNGNSGNAEKEVDRALNARATMATSARAHGTSMVVPLYADVDDTTVHAAPAFTPRSTGTHVTYRAIDLGKAKVRLDAAKRAIDNRNDQSAKDSLAGIDSDLTQVIAPLRTRDRRVRQK